jgi:hypothetical protein
VIRIRAISSAIDIGSHHFNSGVVPLEGGVHLFRVRAREKD